MNLDALYSTIDILKYLGAICNDTSILDDKKNRLNPLKDLELNKMHKIIYTAVENIYLNNGVKEVDEISINMFLSGYHYGLLLFQHVTHDFEIPCTYEHNYQY